MTCHSPIYSHFDLCFEFLALIGPPDLLASQSVDECRCGIHLPLAGIGVVHEDLLLSHGCVVDLLHFGQFCLLVVQLGLGLVQLSRRRAQSGLLNRQVSLRIEICLSSLH